MADVLLLNEIGLDPGIDHCSAISLVNKLHSENKEILSFTSFCGGLPAPDVPFGPLRYKFSWSPRAVLTAALNAARFRLNKQVCACDLLSFLLSNVFGVDS
jgi:alpha-aminoadipic semialdehyde synthase